MKRSYGGVGAAALVAAIAALTPPATAAPPTGALPVDSPIIGADGVRNPAGDPAPDRVLHVSFALRVPNQAAIDAYGQSQHNPLSPNYRHWITPQQFGAMFGASDTAIGAVTSFARANGLTVEHVWPNRLFVTLEGTVAQFERATNVAILGYNRPGAVVDDPQPTCISPDRPPTFPSDVASVVRGVYGLTDMFRLENHLQQLGPARWRHTGGTHSAGLNAHGSAWPGPLTAQQVQHVYNNDQVQALGYRGDGMTIGIFSPTNFTKSDVDGYATTYGLSGYTVIEYQIDGGATDSNGAAEAALDGELIISQAPHATVIYFEGPNTLSNNDILNAIATMNVPVVSDSWGLAETSYHSGGGDGLVASQQTVLQQMDLQGISHQVASGDSGAYDDGTNLGVDFPSSSPNCTAVGGTALPTQGVGGMWDSEITWGGPAYTTEGGGGGLSIYFNEPSWQAGPGVTKAQSNGKRQTPDVSALADPATPGYSIYYSGTLQQFGGTSCAAPVWSGNVLLVDQALAAGGSGRRIGNIDEDLYRIGSTLNAASNLFAYHDITSGTNLFYSATANWDFATGWGSGNFDKVFLDLLALPDLLPYNPGAAGPGGTWVAPIVVHTGTVSPVEPLLLKTATAYNIGTALINNGQADSPACLNRLTGTGGISNTFAAGPYASSLGAFATPATTFIASLNLQAVASLPAGVDTLTLQADVFNTIAESNEANNTYTRTIGVASTSPNASSVAVNPSTVVGGNTTTGTITLATAAPSGGAWVALTTSNSAAATTVPAVQVTAGQTTANFTITTYGVGATTSVTISALCGSATVTTTLSVTKAIINTVTLSQTPIAGGNGETGTINLTGAAPPGGLVCTTASTVTGAATVPPSVTVPAGATFVTFTIVVNPVQTDTATTISATAYGSTRSVLLTVQYPRIMSYTFTPNPVAGGTNVMATVVLTGPAGTGGFPFAIASNNFPIAQVPATMLVAQGATAGSFLVTTRNPAANTTVTITLTSHGVNTPQTLTVQHH